MFGFLVLAPTIAYCSFLNIGAITLRPDKYNTLSKNVRVLAAKGRSIHAKSCQNRETVRTAETAGSAETAQPPDGSIEYDFFNL